VSARYGARSRDFCSSGSRARINGTWRAQVYLRQLTDLRSAPRKEEECRSAIAPSS
jgi:hypothetical protein